MGRHAFGSLPESLASLLSPDGENRLHARRRCGGTSRGWRRKPHHLRRLRSTVFQAGCMAPRQVSAVVRLLPEPSGLEPRWASRRGSNRPDGGSRADRPGAACQPGPIERRTPREAEGREPGRAETARGPKPGTDGAGLVTRSPNIPEHPRRSSRLGHRALHLRPRRAGAWAGGECRLRRTRGRSRGSRNRRRNARDRTGRKG